MIGQSPYTRFNRVKQAMTNYLNKAGGSRRLYTNPLNIATVLSVAAVGAYFIAFSSAATSQIFLVAPSQVNYPDTNTFRVQLILKPSESLNAVQANISYPADLLELVSVTNIPSEYGIANDFKIEAITVTNKPGVIKIVRGTTSPSSRESGIALIKFKAKAVGQAKIQFAEGTNVANDGTYRSLSKTDSIIPIVYPAPPPPCDDNNPDPYGGGGLDHDCSSQGI